MINLYVIKYIYYHINKADRFMEQKPAGKKAKAYPIYQNEIPISRQRFDRINKGMTFEISSGDANFIIEKFGIDNQYFRKNDPVAFEIEGINLTDWKCFYNDRYNDGYSLPDNIDDDICEQRAKKVLKTLKALVKSDWENNLEKDNPLFAVLFYFHYGKRSDRPSSIKIIKDTLRELDYKEWDHENAESLKEIYGLLKKHYNYINSIMMLDKLRNEKKSE